MEASIVLRQVVLSRCFCNVVIHHRLEVVSCQHILVGSHHGHEIRVPVMASRKAHGETLTTGDLSVQIGVFASLAGSDGAGLERGPAWGVHPVMGLSRDNKGERQQPHREEPKTRRTHHGGESGEGQ